jgi:hypothetical protein
MFTISSIKQIPRKYLFGAIIYSILFPITYLLGGMLSDIWQLVYFPLLPGAMMISEGFTYIFGRGYSYLIGLSFGIFLQLLIILLLSQKCFVHENYKTQIKCFIPKLLWIVFAVFIIVVLRISLRV